MPRSPAGRSPRAPMTDESVPGNALGRTRDSRSRGPLAARTPARSWRRPRCRRPGSSTDAVGIQMPRQAVHDPHLGLGRVAVQLGRTIETETVPVTLGRVYEREPEEVEAEGRPDLCTMRLHVHRKFAIVATGWVGGHHGRADHKSINAASDNPLSEMKGQRSLQCEETLPILLGLDAVPTRLGQGRISHGALGALAKGAYLIADGRHQRPGPFEAHVRHQRCQVRSVELLLVPQLRAKSVDDTTGHARKPRHQHRVPLGADVLAVDGPKLLGLDRDPVKPGQHGVDVGEAYTSTPVLDDAIGSTPR